VANSPHRCRVQSGSIRQLNSFFNADPSVEFAQSSIGIRYYKKYGGRYIKERDMDPLMHQNDRGVSMQRKRIHREEFFALPSKSLGRERSVSRIREPSQNSRGNSSARTDAFAYIPAHQRNRRIGESNSDSRRKEFYDRHREAESSHDHGHDYAKNVIATRTTARIGIARDRHSELSATQGVVAEILRRIVAATPGRK
jgi:hypothetical protein